MVNKEEFLDENKGNTTDDVVKDSSPRIENINVIAVFLLLLAVSGNFVGETLSCQSQKFLSNNMFAKHIIIVSMLFFTMTLTDKTAVHPLKTFGWSLAYWGLFLLATKTNLIFTIILFFVLGSIFVLQNYVAYLEEEGDKEKDIETIEKIIPIVTYVFLGILILGFLIYFYKQFKDHRQNFNPLKFLFGVPECGKPKLVAAAPPTLAQLGGIFGKK